MGWGQGWGPWGALKGRQFDPSHPAASDFGLTVTVFWNCLVGF